MLSNVKIVVHKFQDKSDFQNISLESIVLQSYLPDIDPSDHHLFCSVLKFAYCLTGANTKASYNKHLISFIHFDKSALFFYNEKHKLYT